jgi:hypothetical protein
MQTVQNIAHEASDYQSNEPDSLFGICQAAGEDLHINPFFLRVGLISVLFFNPMLMIGAYLALGLVVGASRVLFPKPQADVAAEASYEQPRQVHLEPELIAA